MNSEKQGGPTDAMDGAWAVDLEGKHCFDAADDGAFPVMVATVACDRRFGLAWLRATTGDAPG